MEEKGVYLAIQTPRQVRKKPMYKNGMYRETDKMSDLICENYPMVLVMSRFGIALGFGEKNIGEVCRQNGVDACTFLTVVNFLVEEVNTPVENISKCLSIENLIRYLHNAHDYFLNFRLPHIRRKLVDAISGCPEDVAFVITKFFDEYAEEVNKHMSYEERAVFPYVRNLLEGKRDPKYNITIFRKRHDQIEMKITELKNILIKYYPGAGTNMLNSVLFDIFATEEDYEAFNKRQSAYQVKKGDLSQYHGNCYLGIDAGSTTTKTALVGEDGTLLYSFYSNNNGSPLKTAIRSIQEIYSILPEDAHIAFSCSTGYGEALMKAALLLDEGEVETVSHYYAAAFFDPEVDCIVDIGGQDMK